MSELRFELKLSKAKKTYVNLVAANNEVLMTSEEYEDEHGANNMIQIVMGFAGKAKVVDKRKDDEVSS